MKFGLNTLLYAAQFTADDLHLVDKAAKFGYDGVEIPFIDLDSLDPVATRRALEAAGLGATACAVLVPGTSLISDDAAERGAGVERLRRCVALAAEMGAEAVVGPLYAPVGQLAGRARTEEEWKRAVEGLRAAAEAAAEAGIFLAIEPLNRFETYFLNTAADALALCQEVGHPALKVQLDTFHANIEENDTAAAIRMLGDHLGHFHASESNRGTPGTGQVHWDAALGALRESGYDGWVTIESFATGIVDLCRAACIWRPIYESADQLARQGLAFLREHLAQA